MLAIAQGEHVQGARDFPEVYETTSTAIDRHGRAWAGGDLQARDVS